MLAETCRGFSNAIREIPSRLAHIEAEVRGHLRIMLVSNLVVPALDDAIAAFHAGYPAVEIIVEVAAWTDVVELADAASDRRRHRALAGQAGGARLPATSSPRCTVPIAVGRIRCSARPWTTRPTSQPRLSC